MRLEVPVLTQAIADRIEQALNVQAAARLHHVARLPGNPLGVETCRFGPILATAVKTGRYHFPRYSGMRGVRQGSEEQVDAALAWLRERGVSISVPLSPFHADERLLRHLHAQGLRQSRFMTVLYATPAADEVVPAAGITVEEVLGDGMADFLAVWRSDASSADWPSLEPLGRAELRDWRCYLARVDGEPAAAGALFVHDGVAVMASGRTRPELRGRGGQSALLQWRVRDAALAGCDVVVSHTAPGSISQRNVERAGLRTAWSQAMWLADRASA